MKTRRAAAERAGISERQQKTAIRVRVLKEEYERQVENDFILNPLAPKFSTLNG